MSSSSAAGDVVHMYSCRCLNIIINAASPKPEPANRAEPYYLRAFVGEDGIHITHHYLTLRTRSRAQKSLESPNKLVQPLALSCLACNTVVYRIVQEISPEAEAREGPVVPTEDWVEQETLRSKSGWIEVFVGQRGCLVGQRSIEQHSRSIHLSQTFSIAVLTSPPVPASTPISPQSQTFSPSSPDSPIKSPIPEQLLPSLPPLFPPPPFSPSHPVFISLSACATERSAELRLRAEEETQRFVQSQLDDLKKQEFNLRRDVEGIWQGYRESWKEVLGKVKEETRLSTASKPDRLTPTSSVKSGAPMSIRDFSPVSRPHRHSQQPHQTPSQAMSFSLLSASLAHGGAHFPTAVSQFPEANTTTRPVMSSQSSALIPTPLAQQINGARSSGSSSVSIRSNHDTRMPGAFRRNMDTSVDIASSVAWAKGEEEMRRRLGGPNESEPTERARKRTSKNLGIGAVEKHPDPKPISPPEQLKQASPVARGDETVQNPGNQAVASSNHIAKVETASLDGKTRSTPPESNGGPKKVIRRVTFDVLPAVATMTHVEDQRKHDPEVELFDLDDLSSMEPGPGVRSAKPERSQPVARAPSYKLRVNGGASRAPTSQAASMPAPRAIPPPSPVNGASRWTGGSLRRSVGLADALPLLSSSVPAGDRVLANPPMVNREMSARTPSPPSTQLRAHVPRPEDRTSSPDRPTISDGAVEPTEAELKHLLAAFAPSHRHAWQKGGRAWEMFHQRTRTKKVKGTIAEEGDDDQSAILQDSESSSDDDDVSNGQWHNPSQNASSLPIQIRPLAEYKPSLERKTSLTDKQGLLVPPLKVTRSHANSATAFRRAAYAQRDRIRSIDPGPALDFNEHEETEEDYLPEEIGEGERGRRHALSILQARSVVPEAGMWRSMAS